MDIDVRNLFESIFRWGHIVAGITWIGLLYFFNWVNGPFAATLDADAKKKVVPELMPRALFWFRWGAAWTGGFAIAFMSGSYTAKARKTTSSMTTLAAPHCPVCGSSKTSFVE